MNNLAMIFPIHAKWVKMIFDGTKKIECRNKIPKKLKTGVKIYIYETLGKSIGKLFTTNPLFHETEGTIINDVEVKKIYEGTGKITGEFVVGRIYKKIGEHLTEYDNDVDTIVFQSIGDIPYEKELSYQDLKKQGYTNQKYAIEITNVIKYDEEWQRDKEHKLITLEGDYVTFPDEYYKLLKAPTEPIAKEEFISWNKMEKAKKESLDDGDLTCGHCPYTDFGEYENKVTQFGSCEGAYCEESMDYYIESECNVQFSPQSPIYVVEREIGHG